MMTPFSSRINPRHHYVRLSMAGHVRAPPIHAGPLPTGLVAEGRYGETYVVAPRKNGTHYWKKATVLTVPSSRARSRSRSVSAGRSRSRSLPRQRSTSRSVSRERKSLKKKSTSRSRSRGPIVIPMPRKKYGRKAPAQPAGPMPLGVMERGADGWYIVTERSNGTHYWRRM